MKKQQIWYKIKQDKKDDASNTNGSSRSREMECSVGGMFTKIPDVDFSEDYSLVVHDITFCDLILVLIVFGLKVNIVDVETAFLFLILKRKHS